LLIVVVPIHLAIVVVQITVPGVIGVKHGSTPKDSVVSTIVETTIIVAITSRANQR
jgi:hypothetical protein